MMIGARTAAWAKAGGDNLPWVTFAEFVMADYDFGQSCGNLSSRINPDDHLYKREVFFDGEYFVCDRSGNNNSAFISSLSHIPATAWRVLVDCYVNFDMYTDNTIINSSTIGVSDNSRSFNLAFDNVGRFKQNWKQNGNESAQMFNDDNPPFFFRDYGVIRGIFEAGVKPVDGGYACYTAFDGIESSRGKTVSASDFGYYFQYPIFLGRAAISADYGTLSGGVRSVIFQDIPEI